MWLRLFRERRVSRLSAGLHFELGHVTGVGEEGFADVQSLQPGSAKQDSSGNL